MCRNCKFTYKLFKLPTFTNKSSPPQTPCSIESKHVFLINSVVMFRGWFIHPSIAHTHELTLLIYPRKGNDLNLGLFFYNAVLIGTSQGWVIHPLNENILEKLRTAVQTSQVIIKIKEKPDGRSFKLPQQ